MVSSEIVINRINDTARRIREVHTDTLGVEHECTYQAALDVTQITLDENLVIHATQIDERLAQQEIQKWISEMDQGGDPWHTAPYINSIPEFNTWNTAASESLKYWLIFNDRQQLLNCKLSCDSTSNGDLDDLLDLAGSNFSQNDLRTEIQQAVNTQNELDSYQPSVVI